MRPISKIDTLFERGEDFTVDPTALKRPVLRTISGWLVSEKVDGTSMRVGWYRDPDDSYSVTGRELLIGSESQPELMGFVAGKSDNASIHPDLLQACRNILYNGTDAAQELMEQYDLPSLTLYGEGYGAGIQKGGGYRPDKAFIAFDIRAGDTYLTDEQVTANCALLGVDRVPMLGYTGTHGPQKVVALRDTPGDGSVWPLSAVWPLSFIVQAVEQGFSSFCSQTEQPAEGIVARTIEPLYDNRGKRLIIKLKGSDFRKGKK